MRKYYKVKSQYDNFTIWNRAGISTIFAGELFTEKELDKYCIPKKVVIPVHVDKIYYSFGVRRELI